MAEQSPIHHRGGLPMLYGGSAYLVDLFINFFHMPQQVQIQIQGSLIFLSGAVFTYDDNLETLLFVAMSGATTTGYAMMPEHAKRVYLALKTEIEKYESRFGVIDTILPKDGLKSPFQKPDIQPDSGPSKSK